MNDGLRPQRLGSQPVLNDERYLLAAGPSALLGEPVQAAGHARLDASRNGDQGVGDLRRPTAFGGFGHDGNHNGYLSVGNGFYASVNTNSIAV